ncbi:MAG: Lytic transglycosylase, catalytic [Candidatus Solibacter sp.]|nr:Lytic transglycosylase, catalytic [Candidatus Solibacter sp.]
MTIRTCSATLILALSCSLPGAPAASSMLAVMVRAYRESPTPARRTAVTAYLASHPEDAALGNLAFGIAAYEQQNWSDAIAALKPLPGKLPKIADYAAYYLAAARVEVEDYSGIAASLEPTHRNSPLGGKARLLEARALKAGAPADAVRLLRDHYTELPQPEGDVTLADCYQAANDLPHAAEFYQRVYYQYLTGAAATRSASALIALKDAMGAAYPEPSTVQLLRRADRLLDAKEYVDAKREYQNVAVRAEGLERDQARVRSAAADYLSGKTAIAWPALSALQVADSEAAAERLYYLAECARKRNDDGDLASAIQQLAARHRQSPWRLKALMSAANRYLLVNRPEDYVPLYRAVYEDFPTSPQAALCHWKVTFNAYQHDLPGAGALLREHMKLFSTHSTCGAALYFFARLLERNGDTPGARTSYQRLAAVYENHYYAMLARSRVKTLSAGGTSPEIAQFVADLRFPTPSPVSTDATAATTQRIERSRLLRSAGLADLADAELRYGSRTDGQAALLAMEIADSADAPHQAMRVMKGMAPEYLGLPVPAAPRKFWELLFPLPYRSDLVRNAHERELDPFLLAGLIRQESEFNPDAVSRAKAYGLTQVRPSTGRLYARQAGVQRFTTNVLVQPAANLKIGSQILRSMLDKQGGSVEQTLASYNAGPNRVVEWLTWNTYREPAEFVESIPFTETRDYVQAVMRNAEMYRRLYEGGAR